MLISFVVRDLFTEERLVVFRSLLVNANGLKFSFTFVRADLRVRVFLLCLV